MRQVNAIQIPAHVKNARRAEKLAADEFWAYHAEIAGKKPVDAKYNALFESMNAARVRRVEAVRQFTLGL
jgi:hypothetical protein